MKIDTSIKERKGCNYCLRRKDIWADNSGISITIFDDAHGVRVYDEEANILGGSNSC
jgi:hypothetical protein